MSKLLALLVMLMSTNVFAQASTSVQAGRYHLLDVEYLDMTYQKFRDNRDPYVPDAQLDYRASVNYRLSMFRTVYWDSNIHMEATESGTPKTVGWHWLLGIRVTNYIDIFSEHHSRHVMEEYRPTDDGHNTFPVEDSFGIKLKLIEDTSPYNKSITSWLFK